MERRATLDKFLVTALPQADTALAPGIGHTATYHTDATLNTGIPATKPTLLLPNGAPAYHPISVAAQILGLHPRTIRLYEAAGLLRPKRRCLQRLFSNDDLRRVLCIRRMIHEDVISIAGPERLLALAPSWEVTRCSAETFAEDAPGVAGQLTGLRLRADARLAGGGDDESPVLFLDQPGLQELAHAAADAVQG